MSKKWKVSLKIPDKDKKKKKPLPALFDEQQKHGDQSQEAQMNSAWTSIVLNFYGMSILLGIGINFEILIL